MITRITLLAVLFSSLYACSAIDTVSIPVTEPPLVELESDIHSIGIINRSTADEGELKILDQIDKILKSGSESVQEKSAAVAIESLEAELSKNDQFTDLKLLDYSNLVTNNDGDFPATLSWEKVSEICENADVDVLYVLEFIDTEEDIQYSTSSAGSINLGVDIPVTNHVAEITTLVTIGWRIYDPSEKTITDEHALYNRAVSRGSGLTPLAALKAVKGRDATVIKSSQLIANTYAKRVLPRSFFVSRKYYKKGGDNFEVATRRVEAGDIEGAAELWKLDLSSAKDKAVGRSFYNLAVYNEMKGELDAALKNATIAYTDYNDKKALSYINTLKKRIKDLEALSN